VPSVKGTIFPLPPVPTLMLALQAEELPQSKCVNRQSDLQRSVSTIRIRARPNSISGNNEPLIVLEYMDIRYLPGGEASTSGIGLFGCASKPLSFMKS